MIIGTSHFVSMAAAEAYYRAQGCGEYQVSAKLAAGEIHLGKPTLKPNQRLVMLDGGKRYGVADDGPFSPRQRWGV